MMPGTTWLAGTWKYETISMALMENAATTEKRRCEIEVVVMSKSLLDPSGRPFRPMKTGLHEPCQI
jgi:hypothetical protein